MGKEDTYQKLMNLLGKMPENLNIIDEQIDVKIQMNYFEASRKNKILEKDKDEILSKKNELFGKKYNLEQKKNLLIQLASIDDVESYRTIEKFVVEADKDIKAWSVLALQESRMILESYLLNEKQIIISTGLGGKSNKLRYFAAINSTTNEDFSNLQMKLIRKEFEFVLKNQDGKVEDLKFDGAFAIILVLVPVTISVKTVIDSVINECNQIGDFVNPKFVLTNVRKYTIEEIKKSWINIL